MSELPISYAGYTLYAKPLNELPNSGKTVVNTINQYSFCLAEKLPNFKKSLLASDVLLPDGIGIVMAVWLQHGKRIKKISGSSLHYHLLHKLNSEHGSCFYLGSKEDTLKKIKARVATEYPNIKVGSYSPPFKAVFNDEDNEQMISAVNRFKPDVLFIGMTAPKQEQWAIAHKNELQATIIGSIGAVFDFYAGTMSRPGNLWVDLGFEWLGRLVNEPKRMWKRYLYYGPGFVYSVIKRKITNPKG